MKFFRYRRPSLKTVLGITKAKKRIKKDLGITALLKPFRWWPNEKRRIKREVGYESEVGRFSFAAIHFHHVARIGWSPSRKAQHLARHSDINLTMGIYTSLNVDDLRDVVSLIPSI